MSDGLSREDLLKFIEFLGEKGLMNPNSAAGRKAAVGKLLSILNDEEARDVSRLDLDDVTRRFVNLKGSEFKPDSVRVYKSRTEASIRDLVSYRKNPLGFKPIIAEQRNPRQNEQKSKQSNGEKSEVHPQVKLSTAQIVDDSIIPIPLRANLVVRIAGIPSDLTQSEAKKLANVILAYAITEE